MKNSNQNIYMTSPIAMMASIAAAAENSANRNYNAQAEKMVEYYSDLSSDSKVMVCDAPYMEMMKEEDRIILLNFLHSEFGNISSFSVHHFNSEASLYKLECSKGTYKMILVLDSEKRISAIDFSKVEMYQMNLAA